MIVDKDLKGNNGMRYRRSNNFFLSLLFAVFSTVKKGATWFLKVSPYYKNYGRGNNQYILYFHSKKFEIPLYQSYKTKKELDKDFKDLLNGKPLILKEDYQPPNTDNKVYPTRFYALKQISDNYCAKINS